MAFCGLLLFLNKRISTNIYGHFELFLFPSQKITLVEGLGARSCFMLPMIVSEQCIGVLTVDSIRLGDFDETAQEYLRLLATQLATAFTLSKAIDALRQADHEKQAHLEGMSHQLIAPLFAIRTHCENLLESRLSAERAKKVLVSLKAQARIAVRTASNFRILADILMHRTPVTGLRKFNQSVPRLVVELARDYQPMAWANEKNIVAKFDEHEEVFAPIDLRTFPQAVSNIIENAVKYSDDFTVISIRILTEASVIRVEVTSQGIPLAPDEVEKIFERGFRSKAAQQKFPPGTGIGLPIARAIVEAHGGRLFAIPTSQKGQTTFVIQLPSSKQQR